VLAEIRSTVDQVPTRATIKNKLCQNATQERISECGLSVSLVRKGQKNKSRDQFKNQYKAKTYTLQKVRRNTAWTTNNSLLSQWLPAQQKSGPAKLSARVNHRVQARQVSAKRTCSRVKNGMKDPPRKTLRARSILYKDQNSIARENCRLEKSIPGEKKHSPHQTVLAIV